MRYEGRCWIMDSCPVPKKGFFWFLAQLMAWIFPSVPLTPKPPGTRMPLRGEGRETVDETCTGATLNFHVPNGARALTQHCRVSATPRGISLVPLAECWAPGMLSLCTEETRCGNELERLRSSRCSLRHQQYKTLPQLPTWGRSYYLVRPLASRYPTSSFL